MILVKIGVLSTLALLPRPCLFTSSALHIVIVHLHLQSSLTSNFARQPPSGHMDLTQVYAISIGGAFGVLLLLNGWPWISYFIRYLSPLTSKYMIYRYVFHRHRLLGPWSLAGVFLQLIYIAENIVCVGLGIPHV